MTDPQPKKSDLPTRVASAVVMVAVAGTALWLGGAFWIAFVAILAFGIIWEWKSLAFAIASASIYRTIWLLGSFAYVGLAVWAAISLRNISAELTLYPIGTVVATDVGAYFAGRAIGGPKIAPRISPSKTWAGLAGGILAATAWLYAFSWFNFAPGGFGFVFDPPKAFLFSILGGVVGAIVAQSGDFFESWMKRRAGVKDSGNILPGHGGLFDRTDGLLAVLFVYGALDLMID